MNATTIVFLLLSAAISSLLLFEAIFSWTVFKSDAFILARWKTFGFTLVWPLTLNLFLSIKYNLIPRAWKLFLTICYIYCIVIIVSTFLGICHPGDLIREELYWVDVPYWHPIGVGYLVMMPTCVLLILHTMFSIRHRAVKQKNRNVIMQINLMGFSAIPFAIIGFALNIVLPNLGIKVPNLGHLFIGIWVSILGYAVSRYKFLVPTLEYASKEIFKIAGEIILVTDLRLQITEHNDAFKDQLGYNDSKGLYLYDIIFNSEQIKVDAEKNIPLKIERAEIKRKNGKSMHAKLKGAILYAGKEKIGMVYILSDITEIVNLNTELENKVVSRTKLLSEAKDEAEDRLRITEIYTRRSIVEMIKNGIDPTRITPTNKNVTVLFSDIRNFTALSERMNALTTIGLLNQYFEKMNKIVIDHDGEIDKLIGDCIMALFDEPENAISCAIAMRKGLSELNDENHLPFRLDSGIGINYGEVSVGNIGSGSKMDLTVIGDIVNSASRLESLTKHYYLPIIISEDVAAQMTGSHDTRFVDHVLVKGKTDPIRIYEVYDQDKNDIKELKKEKAPQMAEAYNEYIVGNFPRAIQLYQTIYKSLPPHTWRTGESADPLVDFYLQRILSLNEKKELGLMKSWNGIYEFSEK